MLVSIYFHINPKTETFSIFAKTDPNPINTPATTSNITGIIIAPESTCNLSFILYRL
ncbi:hypothetical protein [Clostridioides sp. ZZV14-6150]|uniref:hypothetical protein n=1 Tax=unclassified Clostridioides TaxID=2635829 RepID=UPI001D110ECB|nr:hypothetical protein [Clostridioides sp. ZZV14-6150]MCC0721638.1 hypothetical protein [Clostridioides sp. ZZV14-6104]